MAGKRISEKARERLNGCLFILPAVIFMLALIGYPIVYNIIISLQDVTATTLGKTARDFVGLENYRAILADPVLKTALWNTFYYTFWCLVFQVTIGFLLALFFSKKFTLSQTVRGFIAISWMLPVTVTALVWKFMLGEGNGIINAMLLSAGLIKEPVGWLINQNTAIWGLIMANSWVGIPFNMLLLTTGLTGIPPEVYESASIDGANGWKRFLRITLPLLRPTMMSVLVLGFVYTFKVFDLVFVMTNGGPVNATEMMSTYSYMLSFEFSRFGEGAAAANILFVCLFSVALLYLKTISKDEVMS